MRRTVIAVTAATGLGLSLAACGSGGSSAAPAKPTGAVFTDAYTTTVGAKSADITIDVAGQTAGKQITATGGGAIDWGSGEGTLDLTVGAAGKTVQVSELITPTKVFVKLPAGSGAPTPWISVSHASFGSQGGDPRQVLGILQASSSGVSEVGTPTVGGVATTEYATTIDPSKIAASIPAARRQQALQALQGLGVSSIPVKAWISRAGQLVQIEEDISGSAPASGSQPLAITVRMDLSHYGVPVSVTPPPADQVTPAPTSASTALGS